MNLSQSVTYPLFFLPKTLESGTITKLTARMVEVEFNLREVAEVAPLGRRRVSAATQAKGEIS